MKGLWQEFRNFAFKGNMIDLAVAVVIGAAFGAVVNSLVKDMIMPLLSYVIPNQGGYLAWHIGRLRMGQFLSEVLNFLIIALAVFIAIGLLRLPLQAVLLVAIPLSLGITWFMRRRISA